jgi:hypothetical protein
MTRLIPWDMVSQSKKKVRQKEPFKVRKHFQKEVQFAETSSKDGILSRRFTCWLAQKHVTSELLQKILVKKISGPWYPRVWMEIHGLQSSSKILLKV